MTVIFVNFNVTALIGTDGAVVERYVYDPYGAPTIYDPNWSSQVTWSSSKKNEILFCGYRWDSETGMYHVRNRSYHPTLGRWLQRDPAGYGDGMNLYQYVRSSPAVRRDPTGLYGGYSPSDSEKKNCLCECGVWKCYKASRHADAASAEAESRFPKESLHNGDGDAWRHCVWSCNMARDIGKHCAKYIADQHEEAGSGSGQPSGEADMDYHNNHVGRELADQKGSCEDLCTKALENGGLKKPE